MEPPKANYTSKCPTELWVRSFFHCRTPDLCSLALVSRYFSQLCQPILFGEQSFDAPDPNSISPKNWNDALHDIHDTTTRMQDFIASPHVLSVKSLAFSGSFDFQTLEYTCHGVKDIKSVEKAYLSLVSHFTGSLARYEHLRVLHFACVKIDGPLAEAISSLPRLETLTLQVCDLSGWKDTMLSLRELTMYAGFSGPPNSTPKDIQPLQIVSPDTLHTLAIDVPEMVIALFSGFPELQAFNNLASLTLELRDAFFPQFLPFLERCPQLTHLELLKSALSCLPSAPLSPSAIPLLSCFKGPRLLAAFFAAERPIETLELTGIASGIKPAKNTHKKPAPDEEDENFATDLAKLAQACPGVCALSVTVTFPTCVKVAAAATVHWPALRELSLVLKGNGYPPCPFDSGSDSEDGDESDFDEGDESDFDDGDEGGGWVPAQGWVPVQMPTGPGGGEDFEAAFRAALGAARGPGGALGPEAMPVPGLRGTILDTVDGDVSGSGSEWEDVDDDMGPLDAAAVAALFGNAGAGAGAGGSLRRDFSDDDGSSDEDEAEDEFTADPDEPALVLLPDAPLAGHLYTVSGDGVASPPPETTAANEGAPPNSFTRLISSLTTLPPALESIRFFRSELDTVTARHVPPTLAEQHHAVLALERACVSESTTQMLREIEFESTISLSGSVPLKQRIWRRVRDGGVDVWSQRAAGAKIVSKVNRGKD